MEAAWIALGLSLKVALWATALALVTVDNPKTDDLLAEIVETGRARPIG